MPEPDDAIEEEGSIEETLAIWRTRGLLSLLALFASSCLLVLISKGRPLHEPWARYGRIVVFLWIATVQVALFCTLLWAAAWKFKRDALSDLDDDD